MSDQHLRSHMSHTGLLLHHVCSSGCSSCSPSLVLSPSTQLLIRTKGITTHPAQSLWPISQTPWSGLPGPGPDSVHNSVGRALVWPSCPPLTASSPGTSWIHLCAPASSRVGHGKAQESLLNKRKKECMNKPALLELLRDNMLPSFFPQPPSLVVVSRTLCFLPLPEPAPSLYFLPHMCKHCPGHSFGTGSWLCSGGGMVLHGQCWLKCQGYFTGALILYLLKPS